MEQLGINSMNNKILLNQFHRIYEKYFQNIKYSNITILEIGVGNKSSMYMFLEYFPNCKYYGIDIEINEEKHDRYELYKGNQNDPNFLNKIVDDFPSFDIIIDDGSHYPRHQIDTFNFLFQKLKKDGIYIVESIETSYWKNDYDLYGNKINFGVLSNKSTMYFFMKILHYVNIKYIDSDEIEYIESNENILFYTNKNVLNNLFSINFYPNCIIIIHN
jgi:hypothetical protein